MTPLEQAKATAKDSTIAYISDRLSFIDNGKTLRLAVRPGEGERPVFLRATEVDSLVTNKYCEFYGENPSKTELAVMLADIKCKVTKILTEGDDKTTPRDFVLEFISAEGLDFDPAKRMFFGQDHKPVNESDLMNRAILDGHDMGIRKEILSVAFEDYKRARIVAFMADRVKSIAYKPNNEIANTLIKAWTGHSKDLDVAVLRHFLWQVKRKLLGMEVTYHLMPILYSETLETEVKGKVQKQGAGKSKAMEALLSYIDPVTEYVSVAILSDERCNKLMTERNVLVFDEMEKATSVNMESIKNKITSTVLSWRTLGLNSYPRGQNIFVPIGASNKHVLEVFWDSTGMRRFYEIVCKNPMDWKAINTLDYVALWASVNENAEPPIIPFLKDLAEKQEELTSVEDINSFFSECQALPKVMLSTGVQSYAGWTPNVELFRQMKEYCRFNHLDFKSSLKVFTLRAREALGSDRVHKLKSGLHFNASHTQYANFSTYKEPMEPDAAETEAEKTQKLIRDLQKQIEELKSTASF